MLIVLEKVKAFVTIMIYLWFGLHRLLMNQCPDCTRLAMNRPRDEEVPASNMKKSRTENLIAEEQDPNNNVEGPTP